MVQRITPAPPIPPPTEARIGDGLFTVQNVTAGIIAVGGAIGLTTVLRWAWLSFVRPGVDDFVFESIRRRRAEVENHLRKEMFKDDIAERIELREMVAEALQIAREASATVEVNRVANDEINEKLERVIPICESFERVERRLEVIDTRGDSSAKALERILGRLDERDRWDGVYRRSGDPPTSR